MDVRASFNHQGQAVRQSNELKASQAAQIDPDISSKHVNLGPVVVAISQSTLQHKSGELEDLLDLF